MPYTKGEAGGEECVERNLRVRGDVVVEGRVYGKMVTPPRAADYAEWSETRAAYIREADTSLHPAVLDAPEGWARSVPSFLRGGPERRSLLQKGVVLTE